MKVGAGGGWKKKNKKAKKKKLKSKQQWKAFQTVKGGGLESVTSRLSRAQKGRYHSRAVRFNDILRNLGEREKCPSLPLPFEALGFRGCFNEPSIFF